MSRKVSLQTGPARGVVLVGLLAAVHPGCAKFAPRHTAIVPGVAVLELDFLRGPLSAAGIPVLSQMDPDGSVWRFVIDTGSEGNVVSPRFAERMGFPRRWTFPYTVVGAEGEERRAQGAVRIDHLRFDGWGDRGSVELRGFDALVADTPIFDQGIDGILGAPLLAHGAFTFDFAAKELTVEAAPLERDGPHTVPLRVRWGGLIDVPVELMGETRWALLDTGSNQFLDVPEERWAELPLDDSVFVAGRSEGFSFGGASSSRLGRLDGHLVIAGHRIERPFLTSRPGGSFVIGSGLLSGLALTIDLRSRLLRLLPSSPAPRDRPAASPPPLGPR